MLARPVNPLHRRVVVLVTLVCFFAACHKWVPIESPVEQALDEQSGKVRITLEGGQQVVLDSAWVGQDSVFGLAKGDMTSVPMAAVAEVEQKKTDVGKTVGLALLGAVAAFGIFVAVALATCPGCD